jgi:membrane fusion protein, type I secretion system
VQHPTGGVVGEVRAHDGDRAGEILIRLDETVTRANLAIVTKGLTELYARKARLAAERDGADAVALPEGACWPGRRSRCAGSDGKRAQAVRAAAYRPDRPEGSAFSARQAIAGADHRTYRPARHAKSKEMGFIDKELDGVRELWEKTSSR